MPDTPDIITMLLTSDDDTTLLDLLRQDPEVVIRALSQQRTQCFVTVRDEIAALMLSLVRQRDALLRIRDAAEAVLTDLPGLNQTFAGEHLARLIAHFREPRSTS